MCSVLEVAGLELRVEVNNLQGIHMIGGYIMIIEIWELLWLIVSQKISYVYKMTIDLFHMYSVR
jgi:hypothetical protein